MAADVSRRLNARPGSWPIASPNALTSCQCFQAILQLTSDGSAEAAAQSKLFAESGGIRAVVQVLEETAEHSCRMTKQVAPYGFSNMKVTPEVKQLLMISDLHEMGLTLLSNLAAIASRVEGVISEELRESKAVNIVVRSMKLYSDNSEHIGAGLAALMQLLPVDPTTFQSSDAPTAIVALMQSEKATPWLLFLGARALARFAKEGPSAKDVLRDAGAIDALLRACRAPPGDADCGKEWGVTDVPAKVQGVARAAIAELVGFDGFDFGGRMSSTLLVNLFLLQDPVVMINKEDRMLAKPDLHGSLGVVVVAGEGGIGPEAASGEYEVRVEYPKERKGETVRVKPANLRLMAT
eukprot:TRINITY_DN12814_c0_g2_i1.p1 TRINITY_DN12814_c0_g2~~TRINITY_DN12814_c0_g2_i1.p1  ORF type:complete len:352 (-),score=48.96 TRINITY_DN12814_c0_g2_i1:88-1143(-)